MEAEILSRYGYPVASIDVEGLKGRGWKKGLMVMMKIPKSLLQSVSILRAHRPRFVLGVGGYSAAPMCLAAKCLGIKTGIHEQNSFPGLTNRLLARFVDLVFISFEESRAYLTARSVCVTGNPVREELFSDRDALDKEKGPFTVLVMGGSQGARAINLAFTEALEHLEGEGKRPEVIHQTGEGDYQRAMADYTRRRLQGEVTPFIQDMERAYHRADMVVSRAGATTVFELATLGKPSILIPYPYAANQHQESNARSLVRLGGAEMILQRDLSGETLARAICRYMERPALLREMGERARQMGRPGAAKDIVERMMALNGK